MSMNGIAKLKSRIIHLLFSCFFIAPVAIAQNGAVDQAGTHGRKSIRAVRTESAVTLDGNLDEPAWQEAPIALGFNQKDPQEGQPSTERTEFRILYTATTLYVGVICYDTEPGSILATDRRRDSKLENDDNITLVIDTFHDHRNAFMFRTNPLGTQYDALITDEGNNLNENWDEKWDVIAQKHEGGWTAEYAIPFKSLRVPEESGGAWGVDIERVIKRKNEQTYWTNYRRGFKLESMSQSGHVQGIENIETGMRFRVKPYLLGGVLQKVRKDSVTANQFNSDVKFKDASDWGMEVMKYRITPSLTADFTWNTDFAQTEVDDQQVNLDRFPLFFEEKREFFLEGAGIYEFGLARAEGTTDMKIFHTRSIGLSEGRARIPVPITAGARMTGNIAGFTLGAMNVQTDTVDTSSIAESNYSVLRVKRNVLARSFIGGFFLNREKGGSGDYNRVYGIDGNFIFKKYLTISALFGKSSELKNTEQDWISNGTIRWEDDFWVASGDMVMIEPNFRDDMGFIPRKNMRRLSPTVGIKPRPGGGFIRQIRIAPRLDYITDRDWNLETRSIHFSNRMEFQSGDALLLSPHLRYENLKRDFEIRVKEGIIARPGVYSWWNMRMQYTANPARRISGSLVVEPEPGYYGGDLMTYEVNPRFRFNQNLAFETDYEIHKFTFGPKETTDHVVNFRTFYNISNQWLTTTTLQYNNVDSFAGLNFRLNYIFRPGDDFFLVYNEGRQVGGPRDGERDRSLQLKLTYSFDY